MALHYSIPWAVCIKAFRFTWTRCASRITTLISIPTAVASPLFVDHFSSLIVTARFSLLAANPSQGPASPFSPFGHHFHHLFTILTLWPYHPKYVEDLNKYEREYNLGPHPLAMHSPEIFEVYSREVFSLRNEEKFKYY